MARCCVKLVLLSVILQLAQPLPSNCLSYAPLTPRLPSIKNCHHNQIGKSLRAQMKSPLIMCSLKGGGGDQPLQPMPPPDTADAVQQQQKVVPESAGITKAGTMVSFGSILHQGSGMRLSLVKHINGISHHLPVILFILAELFSGSTNTLEQSEVSSFHILSYCEEGKQTR